MSLIVLRAICIDMLTLYCLPCEILTFALVMAILLFLMHVGNN